MSNSITTYYNPENGEYWLVDTDNNRISSEHWRNPEAAECALRENRVTWIQV